MKSRREFMFKEYGDHRDLHVLTHSFPTRRSSDLRDRRVPALQDRHHRRRRAHLSEGGRRMADFTNEQFRLDGKVAVVTGAGGRGNSIGRSEEHTSELQSLMRTSSAVFCLHKKITH